MKTSGNKSALIIAYHFPPVAVSSGMHRMIALANALAENDWDVSVLSAHERTYPRSDPETLSQLAPSIRICRSQAFDTAQHLSIKGKYLQLMALPDNLQSWILFGVSRGLREIYRRRPSFILSTYPIASAHVIALILHRLTGIPWVADFRDPMAQEGYPADPLKWNCFNWIEKSAAKHASLLTFATPGALAEYQRRYPEVPDERWMMVSNGFDEEQYKGLSPSSLDTDEIVILHSGLIYIHERNPRALFQALSELKKEGLFESRKVRFVLRASGHESTYQCWLQELAIESLVGLAPQLPYREALQEMFDVDGLLLLQGAGCNQQIPAKAYEYLRAQKPVLALTDKRGDTAQLLRQHGIASIASLDNKDQIIEVLRSFIGKIKTTGSEASNNLKIDQYSRSNISNHWVGRLSKLIMER
ncbi:hypothetical protein DV711_04310 [Motiliproteus coralliicola]|uniref:Glycosyltransferase subfamily 4-like N-terminal domain-containing protein n=1 Tax=Motiliproteus coralliicola TaxID=2283196 RepID=A0A369WW81_9GAMM|nr:glycosyltransferase [Motiliproteus coralliicola]RDE24814.1 hypothetical protein DV711_04310 [Motiliproteus coralliicola]